MLGTPEFTLKYLFLFKAPNSETKENKMMLLATVFTKFDQSFFLITIKRNMLMWS